MKLLIVQAVWAALAVASYAAWPAVEAGGEAAALAADDECAAEDEQCALNALQLRGLQQRSARAAAAESAAEAEEEGCHTVSASDGGKCWSEIQWAINVGFKQHPDWYPGLNPATSSIAEWQVKVWNSTHSPCPKPCGLPQLRTAICSEAKRPAPLWSPREGTPNNVKVLSYNLFWWNLFRMRHGNGNSAGRLIKNSNAPEAYDVMGFQECEDPEKVLGPVGLLGEFEAFQGNHAICMAYRKTQWELLDHGEHDVAQDMRTEYYGKRGAQWMRLQRKGTGETLLFLNHHGPLSVNSGGDCGGEATAYMLLDLMHAKGQPGDLIILVGDFNANAASLTIQNLWPHLVHVYNGDSFGGVDNIFSNVASTSIVATENLGSGGSDHNAISATVATGTAPLSAKEPMDLVEPATAVDDLTGAGAPGDKWENFWCGLLENSVQYTFPGGSVLANHNGVTDPRQCCRLCQRDHACQGWLWTEWDNEAYGPLCSMRSKPPTDKQTTDGYVSGLPVWSAAAKAQARSASSIHAVMA